MEFFESAQELNSWVDLVMRTSNNDGETYPFFRCPDYVTVIALYEGSLTLVKQFRIALNMETIELPSGLIDEGQTPYEAAVNELEEEAGLIPASDAILLPRQYIDSARLTSSVWPFLFKNTKKKDNWVAEENITPFWVEIDEVPRLLSAGALTLASHSGMLALLRVLGEI